MENLKGKRQNGRVMPFLCRDAVVRESKDRVALVGPGSRPPTLVLGNVASGANADFENAQIRKAGEVLGDFLRKITGAACVTVGGPTKRGEVEGPAIYVGPGADPETTFSEIESIDGHGFVIATRQAADGADLHLVGASGTATLYAAWFFLMNYAGLRIVLPGEIGEVYERADRL